jgi:predicted DNA-binding protein YlxM (UPF0122 family)
MAKNLKDDELRNKRVLEVAEYVKRTKASTRQTAKYFTENFYAISNATVNDYLRNRLSKLNKELYLEINKIIANNTPKTVETVEVRKRVYSAVSLLFKDYTIAEIAEELHSTVDIIYDDLTNRLPKIENNYDILYHVKEYIPSMEESISNDVKNQLAKHRRENLVNQEGNSPYFDSEYFKNNNVSRKYDGTFESFPKKK